MILFKKWAKHKVKSYTFFVNQFYCEKRHKQRSQKCKQKQSLLFNFSNILVLLITRTKKIAWRPPVFKPKFYIFSYIEQLRKIWRNFIDKFLLYHTSLIPTNSRRSFYHISLVETGLNDCIRKIVSFLEHLSKTSSETCKKLKLYQL